MGARERVQPVATDGQRSGKRRTLQQNFVIMGCIVSTAAEQRVLVDKARANIYFHKQRIKGPYTGRERVPLAEGKGVKMETVRATTLTLRQIRSVRRSLVCACWRA